MMTTTILIMIRMMTMTKTRAPGQLNVPASRHNHLPYATRPAQVAPSAATGDSDSAGLSRTAFATDFSRWWAAPLTIFLC
jgi:hypothetical protein